MQYTLAITSCNRHSLLQRTLDSFLAHADSLPTATVILEDSDTPKPAWLAEPRYRALGTGLWKTNGWRRGQIYSIDSLYDEIKTEHVFHCEDDWQFTRGNFIRTSFDILQRYADVSCVSLRGNNCNGHPLVRRADGLLIQQPGWQGGWGGYSFNPGLRRLSDLKHIGGSFGRFVGYGTNGCGHELEISHRFLSKGFNIAASEPTPHVLHTGHVSRAVEWLAPMPRVLLAVFATRQYDYGTHHSGIKRVTEGRIEAVRDTWMQDAKCFPNVTARFFYGDELGVPDDYLHLPDKTKALCRYALDNDYDFLVKADDDTAIHVDRLMRSGFDKHDQMGYYPCRCNNGRCFCYATGMCYTLSRPAMQIVVDAAPLPADDRFRWAEDYTVGKALRAAGVKPKGNPGWVCNPVSHYLKPPFARGAIAAHSVTPEDMRAWYAALPSCH